MSCFRIEMEDWEHVTTCKNLMLSSQETHTGHKGFICVGTTHVHGEDITCRGRVSTITESHLVWHFLKSLCVRMSKGLALDT